MHLVDPTYPKHTRYAVYTLFALLLVAILALGATSIMKSITDLAHVSEDTAEFTDQAKKEIDERFSQPYAEETDTPQN